MIIQKAQFSDLPKILALQKECYLQEAAIYNDYHIPPLVQTLAAIEASFEHQTFLKLVLNYQIIGAVRAYEEKGICKIGRLMVHPDFHNKGFGKQLMEAIEKEFPKVNRYELFTGHESQKNLKFYQKLGYLEFHRKRVHEKLELIYLEKKQS